MKASKILNGIVPTARVLDRSLLLIVPNKDGIGKTINPRPVIESLYEEIFKYFTGLREWEERGFWINAQGKLIREENTILKVSFQEDQEEEIGRLIVRFKKLAASVLNQETVAVELDGKLNLIPVSPKKNDDTDE